MINDSGVCKFSISIIASALLLASCGGSSSDKKESDNQVPVAVAGSDLLVSKGFNVDLDGGDSSDGDNDALSFTWTQIAGPDVTEGVGSLSGETPRFVAPDEVGTIIFELVVNDGEADSTADTLLVNVLENANVAYFVDGDNGDDETGNGSQDAPFASIGKALCEVSQEQQDIYVMTRADDAVYDETADPCAGEPARDTVQILSIPTGTSLYGGYDASWVRDVGNNPATVNTLHHGIIFTHVDLSSDISGFKVQAADTPDPSASAYALSVLGGSADMSIHDNQLTAGNVAFGEVASPGSSYGLRVALIDSVDIERNVISAGLGGDALDVGNLFSTAATRGSDGAPGVGQGAGAGGDGKGSEDYDGGAGGGGGGVAVLGIGGYGSGGSDGQGSRGGDGGARGSCLGCGGSVGISGDDGSDGSAGLGGNSSGGMEVYEDEGFFVSFTTANGATGKTGEAGHGGGGGGGGRGNLIYSAGGGGGGGGGGAGGAGGKGGSGGGASIGLFIAEVIDAVIDANDISSGPGGYGASGGLSQVGGDGGAYGNGASASAGNGGHGGTGGKGGAGGRGGAGGGGPSYGIAVGSNIAPQISNNDISSDSGGLGGDGGDAGNGGDGGDSYAVFDLDTGDGIVPVLNNNNATFGVAGEGGTTVGTGGSAGSAGQSGVRNWE